MFSGGLPGREALGGAAGREAQDFGAGRGAVQAPVGQDDAAQAVAQRVFGGAVRVAVDERAGARLIIRKLKFLQLFLRIFLLVTITQVIKNKNKRF